MKGLSVVNLAKARLLVLLFLVSCLKPAGIRYPGLPTMADGALQVIAFDVGQADALLVLYRGKSLLIDAGTSRNEPNKAVQRIPRRLDALLGKRHIDYFLISHYHRDHIGGPGNTSRNHRPTGLFALIEREGFTIGTLLDRGFWTLDSKKGDTERNYEHAIGEWLASGAVERRRQLRPGDSISLGDGLSIDVVTAAGNGQLDRLKALFPSLMTEYHPTENDYSLGLKITLGDFEMFTAGDLSGRNVLRQYGSNKESYNDMESRIAKEVGEVEVYRVDHHGSRFSSNACFLQVLAPMVSVISSGDNSYGHPDPEIYKRLKSYGDVRITGGADRRVRDVVQQDIVGDDVEVLVAPDGKRFWVNGKPYRSLSEEAERARPKFRAACDDTLGQKHAQGLYETPEAGDSGAAD